MIDARTYPKPALTAAVTNLERQGYLSIAQPLNPGPFRLTRLRRDDPPHSDEAGLMRELFANGDTIDVDTTIPANRRVLATARKQHEAAVRSRFGAEYYKAFGGPLFLCLTLAAAAAACVLWMMPGANFWVGAGAFFVAMIGTRQAFGSTGIPPQRRGAIAAVLLLALLVALPIVLLVLFAHPPLPYILVAAIGAGHGLIGAWLPRPTEEGLRAHQAVKDLHVYLEVSKPSPAEIAAGREAADARYRALRPYAMAMGTAPAWNTRHLALLGAMGVAVWAATHAHGSGADSSGWTSHGSSSDGPALDGDVDGTFGSEFDSAFADAFDSAVSDSSDSGSSDSGGGDSSGDGGGSDGGGGGDGGSSE
ncbi:MAG TPA: hypothetical protein VJ890_26140 [Vineibacter sp.]|nr:hypothetical protein [Vineibacter sp.]